MDSPLRKISLEFDPYIPWHRGMLRGIEAFAREAPDWRLLRHRMIPGQPTYLHDLKNEVDGVISNTELGWVMEAGIPLIRFGGQQPRPGYPVVVLDYTKLGRMAAQDLIDNGYTQLGHVETRDPPRQDILRAGGFRQYAAERGVPVEVIELGFSSIASILNDKPTCDVIASRIRGFGKPVGLFARNLADAYVLHAVLEASGLSIPNEVGLIAGGNDRELLEALEPPLTSVSRNSYRIGYTAAQTLNRMMNGEAVESSIVIPPAGVIDRGSTRLEAIGDPVVQRARTRIRQQIGEPFDMEAFASSLGVSGRSLRRRFQATMQHSPVREVQLARLEKARDLLANSRASILEIAQQCGLSESCQLSTFFKSETGMTPTEFRDVTVRPER